MHGIVLRVHSDFVDVLASDGGRWQCTLAGRIKKEAVRTSLVAAGDRVEFEQLHSDTLSGRIESIAPRERVLSRVRPGGGHPYEDVILANPDEIMIVFAAAQPTPHLRMLDRFLVAAEAADPATIFIAVNKVDLAGEANARAMFGLYEQIGYPVIYTSVKSGAGIDRLRQQLQDRITVVAGPSGVGKSSLINAIQPGLKLRVGEVMDIGKGRHTTRAAELRPLDNGGFIADTPGLRELGLWDVRPEELSDYFPDLRRFAVSCRFSFCTHLHEPGCAVRAACERGEIAPERWDSYQRLFRGEDE